MSEYTLNKIIENAERQAHADFWEMMFKLTLYWAVGYLVFFLFAGMYWYRHGLKEVPHGMRIIVYGLLICFGMFFFATMKAVYWISA